MSKKKTQATLCPLSHDPCIKACALYNEYNQECHILTTLTEISESVNEMCEQIHSTIQGALYTSPVLQGERQ